MVVIIQLINILVKHLRLDPSPSLFAIIISFFKFKMPITKAPLTKTLRADMRSHAATSAQEQACDVRRRSKEKQTKFTTLKHSSIVLELKIFRKE